jgi:4-alpha-glucanotransferase
VWLKGDLPFVCGRDSADVWAHPEWFDLGSSAGAPPDAFSATGQAWGLPLYNWEAMRASGYAWWRQRARQATQLYDMFRVDHVIGLYRTWAIPMHDGGTAGFVPDHEAEQLRQGREVLGALLEEAGRDTAVIAEDLGTVPDWARASLTELGIPGYKVLRWERYDGTYLDPRTYSALSVATTGTHDTDTLPEWWESLEHAERSAVIHGLDLSVDSLQQPGNDLSWTADLHLALLQRLYEAGSQLTILPIQDIFGWRERINVPATIDPQNWVYRLPVAIEALDHIPAIRERLQRICALTDATARSVSESL